jgi:hypothetical protein
MMENEENIVHVKMLPNGILLGEVKRLVAEGHSVTLRVKGNSMLPFIYGTCDNVRLVKPAQYHVRDIALAEVGKDVYVVHRIIAIDGDRVTLMGDGNIQGKEYCRLCDLAGLVDCIIRNDREINPYSELYQRMDRGWKLLLPVRRWILAIFRHTVLKSKVMKL